MKSGPGGMRKEGVSLALVTAVVVGVLIILPGPAAAGVEYAMKGYPAEYQFSLLDHCDKKTTYPANTPIYIIHGFNSDPWTVSSVEYKTAYMGSAMYFELKVDGVVQHLVSFDRTVMPYDIKVKLFIWEEDRGLTGTHTFEGFWYVDGYIVGTTPGVSVLDTACTTRITFT